mgnify:CR=1 FL=1
MGRRPNPVAANVAPLCSATRLNPTVGALQSNRT